MNVFRIMMLLLGLCLVSPGYGAPKNEAGHAVKKIGILMFSDEARYNQAADAFVDRLRKEGFREPNVRFYTEKADANKGKLSELVKQFSAAKMDLILTLGTSATVALVREIRDVPVVFAVVYDPVQAGIAREWRSSGNNTTGTSSRVQMGKLVERLQQFRRVKRLAVLYTPGEKNSETQLKDLQDIQAGSQMKVIPVPLTRKEEVTQILPEVIRASDAIYLSGSNLVDSQVEMIVQETSKSGVITVTHLEDLVEKGVLLGLCPNPGAMGRHAAEKALRIFRGVEPSSIPIERMKNYDLILNMRTVKRGTFSVPPPFLKTVTRVIE